MSVLARTILRRSWGASLLTGLVAPIAVALSFILVGVPIFGWLIVRLLQRHLRVAGCVTRPQRTIPVVVVVAVSVLLGVGSIVGEAAGQTMEMGAVGAGLVPIIVLGALAPLAFVLLVMMERDRDKGLAAVLTAALEGWRACSLDRRAQLGVLASAPWAVIGLLIHLQPGYESGSLSFALTVAVTVPLLSAHVVEAWSSVRNEALAFRPDVRPPRGVIWLGTTMLLVSAVAVVLLGGIIFTPLSMSDEHVVARRGLDPSDVGWTSRSTSIPGTSLHASPDPRGVRIEADDGGGVGLVRWKPVRQLRVEAFPSFFRIHAQDDGYERAFVDIDQAGVRLDDGFGARFEEHIGFTGLLLLLMLPLGWVASGTALVRLQRARRLRDLRSSRDHEGSRDERRVLEGRLKLGDAAAVEFSGKRLRVDGPAWVEGSGLRVALPPEGVVLRGKASGELDGSKVSLVGLFTRLTSESLREATAPWPTSAVLVLGGRDQALELEVRRASSIAVLALAPTLIAAVSFAIVMGLGLL